MSTARRAVKASRDLVVALVLLLCATQSEAATLTITPDKSVYNVGENIVLNVFGDPEGARANSIFGQILFEAGLATLVGSTQTPLTSLGGAFSWQTLPLADGPGFAAAFRQITLINPEIPDGPLTATVVLQGVAPGTLSLSWDLDPLFYAFFGLENPQGAAVTIVPEPAAVLLLALGLAAIAATAPRSRGAPS